MELLGELGRHDVYRGEGDYRVSTWQKDDATTTMLRKFEKDLINIIWGRVTRSHGEGHGVHAREAVPEYIPAIACQAHFSSTSKGEISDAQVYKRGH